MRKRRKCFALFARKQREKIRLQVVDASTSNIQRSQSMRRTMTTKSPFKMLSWEASLLGAWKKNNEKTGSSIKASFNTVFFIVKEEMPLTKFGALVNLQITNGCNDFKNITHQHHSHVTEMVEIIFPCIEGKTISILRESPFVGVLLDETSDIRVYKKLVILYPSLVTQCSSQSAPLRESRKNREMAPNKSV